ncbi:MAG: hypothetical protein WCG03_06870, partial [Kiritimatiellales bacterium]
VKLGRTMPAKDDNPHSLKSFFCLGASGEWDAKKKDPRLQKRTFVKRLKITFSQCSNQTLTIL